MSRTREAGQATPILALVLVVAVGVAAAIGVGGRLVVARARAQTAADAAALAGAAEGEDAALELAEANEARLTSFERSGAAVTVRVAIGPVAATARATVG